MYSSALSLTLTLDEDGWSTACLDRSTTGKDPLPFYGGQGWAQGRSGHVRKISPTPGFDPLDVQPVASSYTD